MALLGPTPASFRSASVQDGIVPRNFSYFDDVPRSTPRESTLVLNHGDVGIGVTLEQGRQGLTHVAALIPGSPADLKGIKCGDAILQVDGESVFGMSLSQVSRRLSGAPGTYVTLKIGARAFDFRRPVGPDQIRIVQVNREAGNMFRIHPASSGTISVSSVSEPPVSFVRESSPRFTTTTTTTTTYLGGGAVGGSAMSYGVNLATARQVFRQFDFDGNGWISMEEYGMAMHALGFRLEPARLLDFFQSIDRDGNERISENEFVDWFAMNQAVLSTPPVAQTFPSNGGHMFDA